MVAVRRRSGSGAARRAGRRLPLCLALAGAGAALAVWAGRPEGEPLPSPVSAALAAPAPRPLLLSAGTTRIVGGGVFRLPITAFAAGPFVGSTPDAVLRASLEIVPEGGFGPAMPDDGEVPGDPVREEMKPGAQGWPTIDRARKGDQDMLGLRPSVRAPALPGDPLAPEALLADPFLAQAVAPPLARLSRRLAPPAPGAPLAAFRATRLDPALALALARRLREGAPESASTPDGDGAVPLDHSLAPSGGTSPAASRPDLAGLDTRTTLSDGERPIEVAAAAGPPVTLAAVHPLAPDEPFPDAGPAPFADADPALAPDEGLTTAQKNTLIAGLPGLDDGQARPLTLPPVAYTKAQLCLATAVYFEARSESETGQIAVAQVVVNRVRSPFYPKNVCDVVYQGASARRWGGCQFSFACTGLSLRVTDDTSWRAALSIAQRVMDAEAWLPEVGNATHYHASYVRPRWVRDMREMDRIGRHIFYRVRWWA